MRTILSKAAYAIGYARSVAAGVRSAPALAPLLSYASLVPDSARPSRGGNVKLTLLDRVFPEQKKCFNLLYLVSSGVNAKAEAWADVCLRQGIKLVWNQNGVAYPRWAGPEYRQINRRMRHLLNKASFVIYQSEFCKKMSDKYLGPCPGRSCVVYNAVDTQAFRPREQNPVARPLRLLVVGSHADPARFLASLEVTSLLRKQGIKCDLTIAGRLSWPNAESELRSTLKRFELEGHVRMRGSFSPNEAPALYREADILLHLQHGDACPSVVLEAMASGVPVVAPESGGIPELVGDSGALVPAPDAEEAFMPDCAGIAEAVQTVFNNYEQYSSASRKRALREFDVSTWIGRHRQIFEELINGKTSC